MRFPILCLLAFVFARGAGAQTILFEDNFNDCALAPGWSVQSTGAGQPVWYVGLSQNPQAPDQSIDSTCFLFIDDDSAGPDTPGYVLEFRTPAFDVRPFTTVECTMDVYFRFGQQDFLQILATDGTTETELALFNNFRTNSGNINDEHFSLRHDLSLVSLSANTRIIIRYTSPQASLGHYAGIDNIRIAGSGTGVNVIREAFNGCAKPAGWQTQILSGDHDWQFGRLPQSSSAFYDGNSMDGSCFVYFDDNDLGDSAAASTIRLYSPWFDGDTFFRYDLTFDYILRYGGSELGKLYLQTGATDSVLLFESSGSVGGPFFPQYESMAFDLSAYRVPQMRLIFEFSDGGEWGYWTGIDNVKVTARDVANEFCHQAVLLKIGDPCIPGDNSTAVFDGPAATCVTKTAGSLWYRWPATITGIVKLSTPAGFNNLVNVYSGTCGSLQPVQCDNRDEHGFSGETTWFSATAGTEYFFRVSGRDEGYGLPRGAVCISLAQAGNLPSLPANDACANAVTLTPNAACAPGNNRNAAMSTTLPSGNLLARADIWYKFTAGNLLSGQHYELHANATFSNIITAYQGSCAVLTEIAGNHRGVRLELPALNAGQTYWLQIAGNFATIEDSLCAELSVVQADTVPNDDCLAATLVPVGGACVAGNNESATFSGYQPSCAVAVDRDIWFKFTAPASGAVHLRTGADFRHTLTLWQGDCDSLTEVFCALNPKRCDGYVTAGTLSAGAEYYVQIATWTDAPGLPGGNVCLKILDGASSSGYEPLELEVLLPCVGADSSLLSAIAGGGTPPYTYTGTALGQILSEGDPYIVVVMDAAGCEQYANGVAGACDTSVCTLTAAVLQQAMTCPGAATGALEADPDGGQVPFNFAWSNGAVTQTVTNLAAGTYGVTVTDALGCPATASGTVNAYAAPDVQISGDPNFCPGDSTVMTASGGETYVWNTGATIATVVLSIPGTYTVTATDALGCTNSATVTVGPGVTNDPDALASVKVFLQGPYVSTTQLMHDSLRTKNLLPLLEPYTGLTNFTHTGGGGGEQTTPAVLAVSGPNAIVDWVFLELHSAANPNQVLATRSALVQRDGDVVSTDGVSPVSFGIPSEQYFFLAVRHRNHLGVQIGQAQFYPACVPVAIDFRSTPPEGFYAYNGLNPAQKTISNIFVLWAGNGRVDYQLKYNGSNNDRTSILSVVGLSTPNVIVPGYLLADYNLDGLVKYNGSANDRNVLLGNVGITTPLAIVHDQIGH